MITANNARKMLNNVYAEACLIRIESAIKMVAPVGRWCEIDIEVKGDICDIVHEFIVEKLIEHGYAIQTMYIDDVTSNKRIRFRISW